jgi:hypothetical protein
MKETPCEQSPNSDVFNIQSIYGSIKSVKGSKRTLVWLLADKCFKGFGQSSVLVLKSIEGQDGLAHIEVSYNLIV